VSSPAPAKGTGQRIWLVDDEPALADATSKLLARYGYRTSVFNDSAEAWRMFSSSPHDFDLVITDLTMPQIAGTELAKMMHDVRSDIPIILTTGSRDDLTNEAAAALGIREVFVKPVDYAGLLDCIRRLLAVRYGVSQVQILGNSVRVDGLEGCLRARLSCGL
jgi:DNA-binding NtrC family response regulator